MKRWIAATGPFSPCQVLYCRGSPVCLCVIDPVLCACKAAGSPSPVVESSETAPGTAAQSDSAQRSTPSGLFSAPHGSDSSPLAVSLLHHNLSLACWTVAGRAPVFKHLMTAPCFWYQLFTMRFTLDPSSAKASNSMPSRAICILCDVLAEVF